MNELNECGRAPYADGVVRPTKQAVADEVWGLLTALMVGRRDAGFAVAESYGLTMGDMKALLSLTDAETPTMSSLAEVWGCDASNVTWLVDRLEQSGCVVRQPSATDRRVKTVALTDRGRTARDRLQHAFTQAPPGAVRPQPRGPDHPGHPVAQGRLRALRARRHGAFHGPQAAHARHPGLTERARPDAITGATPDATAP